MGIQMTKTEYNAIRFLLNPENFMDSRRVYSILKEASIDIEEIDVSKESLRVLRDTFRGLFQPSTTPTIQKIYNWINYGERKAGITGDQYEISISDQAYKLIASAINDLYNYNMLSLSLCEPVLNKLVTERLALKDELKQFVLIIPEHLLPFVIVQSDVSLKKFKKENYEDENTQVIRMNNAIKTKLIRRLTKEVTRLNNWKEMYENYVAITHETPIVVEPANQNVSEELETE